MPVVSLPDSEWIEMVGPVAGIEAVPWDIVAEPPRRDEIELVVPPYIGDRAPLRRLEMLPSLRAVQLLTAGYDDVLPLLPPGVTLANAAKSRARLNERSVEVTFGRRTPNHQVTRDPESNGEPRGQKSRSILYLLGTQVTATPGVDRRNATRAAGCAHLS